jgi:TPP-dependent 2-oxoacid decarboxylase
MEIEIIQLAATSRRVLRKIGVNHNFAVAGDFNLVLLDQLFDQQGSGAGLFL